jgi:type IV pilus assembly protein PilM
LKRRVQGNEDLPSRGQRTNVNTLLADPFAGMAISPRIRAKQLAADAPSLMVACGLALRKFDQ